MTAAHTYAFCNLEWYLSGQRRLSVYHYNAGVPKGNTEALIMRSRVSREEDNICAKHRLPGMVPVSVYELAKATRLWFSAIVPG